MHRYGAPSSMVGESHDDEPRTRSVQPITLRFVNKGEPSWEHAEVIYSSGLCCVRVQILRSPVDRKRSHGTLSALCHDLHTWSLCPFLSVYSRTAACLFLENIWHPRAWSAEPTCNHRDIALY